MMILFEETYYAESFFDFYRDCSEFLESFYQDHKSNAINVEFTFTHNQVTKTLHKNQYDFENYSDIEDNIHYQYLELKKQIGDSSGFFDGDLIFKIYH